MTRSDLAPRRPTSLVLLLLASSTAACVLANVAACGSSSGDDAGTPDAGATTDGGTSDGSVAPSTDGAATDGTVADGGVPDAPPGTDGGPRDGASATDAHVVDASGDVTSDGAAPTADAATDAPGDAEADAGTDAGRVLAALGAPCSDSGGCASNVCNTLGTTGMGYCSVPCSGTTECASQAPGMSCTFRGSSGVCTFECDEAEDCAAFGATATCRRKLTTENNVVSVCDVWSNQPPGSPCSTSDQCAGGFCNGAWCEDACANDGACGSVARCVESVPGSYACSPACDVDDDCKVVSPDAPLRCSETISRDGMLVKVCTP